MATPNFETWDKDDKAAWMERLKADLQNHLMNQSDEIARSFNDLALATYRAMNEEPRIRYIPTPEHIRKQYQYYTKAEMDKLIEAGYDKSFTTLEDGISKYVNNYLSKEDQYR